MNKTIRGGAREIIYKVFLRYLAEFQAGRILSELEQVYKRAAADMTGKSKSTVRRIVEEGNKIDGKLGHLQNMEKDVPDKLMCCAPKSSVFYTVKKEVPTLRKLFKVLKEDIGYEGSREPAVVSVNTF